MSGPEFGWAAVDELGAELDDLVGFADGVDAAADSGAGFEEGDGPACFGEGAGGGEAGHAGSDDEDVGMHVGWMLARGFRLVWAGESQTNIGMAQVLEEW